MNNLTVFTIIGNYPDNIEKFDYFNSQSLKYGYELWLKKDNIPRRILFRTKDLFSNKEECNKNFDEIIEALTKYVESLNQNDNE